MHDNASAKEKSGANKRELLFCKQILLSFVWCELSRRGAWSGVVAGKSTLCIDHV